jgi:transposase
MMGRLKHDQQQLFYSFHLDEAVPHDHPVREIAAVLDLSWVHSELAPFYPKMGRPSIDPELMIRMLIIGYVFAIRSERAICRDLQVNLAYRWFCGLSIEDKIPDHSVFSRARQVCSTQAEEDGRPVRGYCGSAFGVPEKPHLAHYRVRHDAPPANDLPVSCGDFNDKMAGGSQSAVKPTPASSGTFV